MVHYHHQSPGDERGEGGREGGGRREVNRPNGTDQSPGERNGTLSPPISRRRKREGGREGGRRG